MKKEVLIAILVGFSLGLIITYGVYRAQKSITQKAAQDEAVETQEPTAQNNEPINNLLSITQPENGTITDKDTITVGGIAQKNALVTVINKIDEKATQADELGNFTIDLKLEQGPNHITISTFNEKGVRQEKELYVVYSSYDFEKDLQEEETP